MRIALFLTGPFPVLSETFILNQITGLIDRGHEVDIYANRPDDTSQVHPDVEHYNLLARTHYRPAIPTNDVSRLLSGLGLFVNHPGNLPTLLRSLNGFKYRRKATSFRLLHWTASLLPKQSYDIINCHFGWNGVNAALLRDIGVLDGKLVTTFHGADLSKDIQASGDRIYKQLFELGDLFLPISEYWKHRLLELGCPEKKVIVQRMGIDCHRFNFTARRLNPHEAIRLVTVCRLVEKKGVEYGIRAVAKLAKVNSNIEYNIVGDGPLREDLQRLIEELNVGDIVKLLGWRHQQQIVEILDRSHILLAPSVTSQNGDREGIPVSLMEAMAMGLPIISTQHTGIPELVENGVSGFLVPERDVDTLAEKLTYLVEHPQVWSEMGRAGRAYVEDHYNLNKLNDRLVEIYQELITGQTKVCVQSQKAKVNSQR
jgi:colanic acid/amylovoran biosynthesis glycosyltransferase